MKKAATTRAGLSTMLALFSVVLLLLGGVYYSTAEDVQITVTDKERVCSDSGDCKYLVFTEDEVFQNTDSVLFWKFESSDYHGLLEPGQTYDARVAGWRIQFFSMYRNIVHLYAKGTPR